MPEKPSRGGRRSQGSGRSRRKRRRPDRDDEDSSSRRRKRKKKKKKKKKKKRKKRKQKKKKAGRSNGPSSPPDGSDRSSANSERILSGGRLVSRKEGSGRSKRRGRGSGKHRAAREGAEPEAFGRSAKLPIAYKISGLTALIVAILMGVLSWYATRTSTAQVNQEINRTGVGLCRLLAETVGKAAFEGPPGEDLMSLSPENREQRMEEWQANGLAQMWDSKFASLLESNPDLLDARILEGTGARLTTLLGTSTEGVELRDESPRPGRGDTEIKDGTWGGDPARWFKHPITHRGSTVGFAYVTIKASAIEQVQATLYTRLAIATAIGLLGALLLSGLMAVRISSPIRSLMRDMEIVSAGRLEHRAHIDTNDEVGVLADAFNEMTNGLQEAQRVESEKQAMEHELEIATEIQTKLLPERIPQIPGFDIFSHYLSAKEVGGDYYDFIVVDQTHLGVVVADVSGKGIPGSMVMTMARSLIRLASHRNASPGDTLRKVNRILAKDMRRGMFVTCCYVVLDVRSKSIRVCSAGHNPLLYYDARKGDLEPVNPSGIALGFDKGPIFEANIQEQEIEMAPGDRIVVYTDGVVEAMDERSEEFGDERLEDLVREHAELSSKDFIQVISEALDEHRGRAEQSDDITITTLLRVE